VAEELELAHGRHQDLTQYLAEDFILRNHGGGGLSDEHDPGRNLH
jgi:hypothetical protein